MNEHGEREHLVARLGQRPGELARRLERPAKRDHRVAAGVRLHQVVEVCERSGPRSISFSRPPPCLRTRRGGVSRPAPPCARRSPCHGSWPMHRPSSSHRHATLRTALERAERTIAIPHADAAAPHRHRVTPFSIACTAMTATGFLQETRHLYKRFAQK